MSAANWAPLLNTPGGNPVMAVPGETPTFPAIVEVPVLVTVWPAKTAKEAAVPRLTGAWGIVDASVVPLMPPKRRKLIGAASTMPATTRCRILRILFVLYLSLTV